MPDQSAILSKTSQHQTRIGNDILFGNIEALGNDFERAQQHTKEFTRINANTAKAIENTARETAAEFSVNSQRSL